MDESNKPHKIFQIPELVDAILIELPIKDLLVSAQRVNRFFKRTIDKSIPLQQRLFFISEAASCGHQGWIINTLLQDKFPFWFPPKNTTGHYSGRSFNGSHLDDEGVVFPHDFRRLAWNQNDVSRDAFARKEASWRRMLIVQPALHALRVVSWGEQPFYHEGDDMIWERKEELKTQGGLTLAPLYDLAENGLYNNMKFPSFWVDWVLLLVVDAPSQGSSYSKRMNRLQNGGPGELSDSSMPSDTRIVLTLIYDVQPYLEAGIDQTEGPNSKSEAFKHYEMELIADSRI